MRIVRVNDVGLERLMTRASRHAAREIHLRPRRDRNQLEPFRRALPQLAVGMGDQRGALADRAQAVDGQQNLVLSAAPGARRVDMEGEHQSV